MLNCKDNDAIDLLTKMIVFNPEKRITIENSLQHPYIESIKDTTIIDPVFEGKLDFSFENEKLDSAQLVQILEKEISTFETGKSIEI